MDFGFSWAGAVFLAMLFVPNIIWSRNTPLGYEELSRAENPVLLALERVGQVAATVTALIFVPPQGTQMPWLLWAVAALALMLLYEAAWARYFQGARELASMYAPLGPIPVPLATLPVLALLCLGIWYQSPLTIAAALLLGVGHIGIHLSHARHLRP